MQLFGFSLFNQRPISDLQSENEMKTQHFSIPQLSLLHFDHQSLNEAAGVGWEEEKGWYITGASV